MTDLPAIWVLKGLRAGDTAQALDLAARIGGTVRVVDLGFNKLHAIPPWLGGISLRHLTAAARAQLQAPWPKLVVATGRRTAVVAAWIKQQSGGETKIVQLGRPRMALSIFDLVVTTPQYGLPEAPNVVEIPVPFGAAGLQPQEATMHFAKQWQSLPRPWIAAVIGAAKFPIRFDVSAEERFAQALQAEAHKQGASVLLFDLPRSASDAVQRIAQKLRVPHLQPARQKELNPYRAALQLADRLVVTSDSVSMVADMLATAKPVSAFLLAHHRWVPHWKAKSGLAAKLAREGVLMPPRDVSGYVSGLMAQGFMGNLAEGTWPTQQLNFADQQEAVIRRVQALL